MSHAQPVATGIWRITTPLPGRPREVHAYLAALDDGGHLLVDGGVSTAEGWAALDAGVRAVGGWAAVRLQVVTHMHMDHIGLARRVRKESEAPLLMGRLDAERSAIAARDPEDEARYRADLLREGGAPEAFRRTVEEGYRAAASLAPAPEVDGVLEGAEGPLPGAGGWRFLWTPGHTAGHVSLLRESDRVVIGGDAVLPRITPTVGVNRQREDPVGDYLESLDRLAGARPTLLLPGHGAPIEDPAVRIDELRAVTRAETDAVLELLSEEPISAWEASERRYPGRELPPGPRMQALRETLAHLRHLVAAERARADALPGRAAGFSRVGPDPKRFTTF